MDALFQNDNINPAHQEKWSRIVEKLKDTIEPSLFQTWILPLTIRESKGSEVVVSVPNLLFYQGLHEFFDKIEYCKTLLGIDDMMIRFEIDGADPRSESEFMDENQMHPMKDIGMSAERSALSGAEHGEEGREEGGEEGRSWSSRSQAFSKTLTTKRNNLNFNYRFENFVRGSSNQFALATCQNVADNPGKSYNPLFIYGSTGLGKTHLMHAVGNRVLEVNPNAVVVYITTERFMNEMIYCIRYNKMWDFRQRYRHCDVFLVDDIQFISNRKATQEEFFHTFNTLYETKKQIVITSDKFPQEIPDIEERLRNRFQWGLIADIQPPDIEHRIAILLNKAEKNQLFINYDVAEFIATNAKRNIRELEGALHRIAAFAALQGRPIDMSLAREIFQNVLAEPPKRLTIEVVQQSVAEHFKLKISDLKSKRRHRALTLPRQIAMYLSRSLTKSSFPEIGEKFGGKDHTTVMHAVKKIDKDRGKDLDLRVNLESLERQLEQLQ